MVLATGYRPLNEAVQKSLCEAKIPPKKNTRFDDSFFWSWNRSWLHKSQRFLLAFPKGRTLKLSEAGWVFKFPQIYPPDFLESSVALRFLGKEITEKLGRVWGLGSDIGPDDPGPWEGELRNMWKPTGQEGLWVPWQLE